MAIEYGEYGKPSPAVQEDEKKKKKKKKGYDPRVLKSRLNGGSSGSY